MIALFWMSGMMSVSAEESADEIVAMISWWEEYGLYWDEMGVDRSLTKTDEEAAFAWLSDLFAEPERSTQ